jgi:hypothetical protein
MPPSLPSFTQTQHSTYIPFTVPNNNEAAAARAAAPAAPPAFSPPSPSSSSSSSAAVVAVGSVVVGCADGASEGWRTRELLFGIGDMKVGIYVYTYIHRYI